MIQLASPGKRTGSTVIEGTIQLPRVGAWHADLKVDVSEPPSGKVDLRIDDHVLVGTVTRAELVEGVMHVVVVAGADGLRELVNGVHYTTPTVRNVLSAIARDVGETVSAAGDATLLNRQLERWTTVVHPAGMAVRALVAMLPEAVWRIREDGGLWIGLETWPDAGLDDVAIIADAPENGSFVLTLETPWLMPGTTVAGRKVDTVKLSFGAGGATAQVWTVP